MDKSFISQEAPPIHRLSLEICNQKGLHARASAQLVKMASQFDAEINVSAQGRTVSALSIMGLMMLTAKTGTFIELQASGKEAKLALVALSDLIKNKFNEES